MSLGGWLIAIAIFIVILLIAIGIGWWLRNHQTTSPTGPTIYNPPLGWGPLVAGPNFPKNTCQLYQFQTGEIDNQFMPGQPTFNNKVLDGMNGTGDIGLICLDPDQILAQQVQHTCTAPLGVQNNQTTQCVLQDGGVTGLGGIEIFYSNSNCPNIAQCPGEISVISLNFQAPTNPIYCIKNNGENNDVTMEECDPAKTDQQFRITRINPGQNPNTLSASQAQNGLIAQILDRNTGLCIMPGNKTSTTRYDPNSVPGCSGDSHSVTGTNIILSECENGPYPGYVWVLLPSVSYCPDANGCTACTGCIGCIQEPQKNRCSGCSDCKGNPPLGIPQQIVYIGDLDFSTFPSGPTAYKGLTGDSAMIQWLLDNNAKSLYYGGDKNENNIVLAPIGIDVNYCPDIPFTAQYLSLNAYNIIKEETACFEHGTLGTLSCVGF